MRVDGSDLKTSEMSVWNILICLDELENFSSTSKVVIFNPNFESFLTFKPKTDDIHEFCVAEYPMGNVWKFSPFMGWGKDSNQVTRTAISTLPTLFWGFVMQSVSLWCTLGNSEWTGTQSGYIVG